MPIKKPVYIKTLALCADGQLRSVYSQISARRFELAPECLPGHVKLDLISVSGRVFITDTEPIPYGNGLYCSNYFEPNRAGINRDQLPSWKEIKRYFMELELEQAANHVA